MNRKTNRATRVSNTPRDRLANPPSCVSRKFESFAPVELFDGVHQTEVALLNQVEQWKARCLVFLGDRDHKAKIGLHKLAFGAGTSANNFVQLATLGWVELLLCALKRRLCRFAFFDGFRQANFVVFGEQNILTDIGEVEPD